MREEFQNVLLVDGGDFFWKRKLGTIRAEVIAKALRMMKYDVLNVADGELSFGLEYLSSFTKLKPMMVGANLSALDGATPFQPFIIKNINDTRVAIVGLVSPDMVDPVQLRSDGLNVGLPRDALKNLLPGLRQKADIILLLSHTGWENAVELLKGLSGIDLAVVGHAYYRSFDPVKIGETLVLKNSIGAKHVGIIKLWLGNDKKIIKHDSSLKEMSSDVHIYPEYTIPETEFEKKKNIANARKKDMEEHKKVLKQFDGLLKLTPEEFAERLKKNGGLIGSEKTNPAPEN